MGVNTASFCVLKTKKKFIRGNKKREEVRVEREYPLNLGGMGFPLCKVTTS